MVASARHVNREGVAADDTAAMTVATLRAWLYDDSIEPPLAGAMLPLPSRPDGLT